MSKIAIGRRYTDDPECGACADPKVIHQGPQHDGRCIALGGLCGKFAPSALVSSPHNTTEQGSPSVSAVHPDETRAVRADSPSRTRPTTTGPGRPSLPAGSGEDAAL